MKTLLIIVLFCKTIVLTCSITKLPVEILSHIIFKFVPHTYDSKKKAKKINTWYKITIAFSSNKDARSLLEHHLQNVYNYLQEKYNQRDISLFRKHPLFFREKIKQLEIYYCPNTSLLMRSIKKIAEFFVSNKNSTNILPFQKIIELLDKIDEVHSLFFNMCYGSFNLIEYYNQDALTELNKGKEIFTFEKSDNKGYGFLTCQKNNVFQWLIISGNEDAWGNHVLPHNFFKNNTYKSLHELFFYNIDLSLLDTTSLVINTLDYLSCINCTTSNEISIEWAPALKTFIYKNCQNKPRNSNTHIDLSKTTYLKKVTLKDYHLKLNPLRTVTLPYHFRKITLKDYTNIHFITSKEIDFSKIIITTKRNSGFCCSLENNSDNKIMMDPKTTNLQLFLSKTTILPHDSFIFTITEHKDWLDKTDKILIYPCKNKL